MSCPSLLRLALSSFLKTISFLNHCKLSVTLQSLKPSNLCWNSFGLFDKYMESNKIFSFLLVLRNSSSFINSFKIGFHYWSLASQISSNWCPWTLMVTSKPNAKTSEGSSVRFFELKNAILWQLWGKNNYLPACGQLCHSVLGVEKIITNQRSNILRDYFSDPHLKMDRTIIVPYR